METYKEKIEKVLVEIDCQRMSVGGALQELEKIFNAYLFDAMLTAGILIKKTGGMCK